MHGRQHLAIFGSFGTPTRLESNCLNEQSFFGLTSRIGGQLIVGVQIQTGTVNMEATKTSLTHCCASYAAFVTLSKCKYKIAQTFKQTVILPPHIAQGKLSVAHFSFGINFMFLTGM
jgi:hypothetical protein